jgi:hypothetical protein
MICNVHYARKPQRCRLEALSKIKRAWKIERLTMPARLAYPDNSLREVIAMRLSRAMEVVAHKCK